jgi:hypothetical protein
MTCSPRRAENAVAGKTANKRLSHQETAHYQERTADDRRLRALIEELCTVGQEGIELTLATTNTHTQAKV